MDTQSPTRLPAWSETMRTVEVPPTSTVYSKACELPVRPPTARPAAPPAAARSARLLLDWFLPLASPSPPPTIMPTFCEVPLVSVTGVTAVMRPYWTRDCACAICAPPTSASSAAAIVVRARCCITIEIIPN